MIALICADPATTLGVCEIDGRVEPEPLTMLTSHMSPTGRAEEKVLPVPVKTVAA